MQIYMKTFFSERTLHADSYDFFLPNAPCMQIHMKFFFTERTLHADSYENFVA